MAKKSLPNPSPEALQSAESEEQTLSAAVDILYGSQDNPLVLRDGTNVVVRTGKLKDVGILLGFFNSLLKNLDRSQFVALVKVLEEEYKAKQDPNVEMQRLRDALAKGEEYVPPPVESVEDLVEGAFDKAQLALSVALAAADTLPGVITALAQLPRARVDDLDLDESAAIAAIIFRVNYSFFSQNLPPVLRLFLAGGAKKFGRKG
jgi:hypothetical protein